LLGVIGDQVAGLQENLAQAHDDQFIETCAPWVVPYIGQLLGVTPLFDASRTATSATAAQLFTDLAGPDFAGALVVRSRADVARTIAYRRRKATRPMLEELARDVTGWGAHLVEGFTRLGWSQCIRNHLRRDCNYAPDLRSPEPLGLIGTAFDGAQHHVDVRAPEQVQGFWALRNALFFLWRLQPIELPGVSARRVGGVNDYRYTASPLGNPAPLFSRLRTAGGPGGVAGELDVPAPIRGAALYDDLAAYQALPAPRPGFTQIYGDFNGATAGVLPLAPGACLLLVRDGVPVAADDVRCMDLSTWEQPNSKVVGLDLGLGRLAFGKGFEPQQGVQVWMHHGFSSNLGGGGYPRQAWLVRGDLAGVPIVVAKSGAGGAFTTVAAAVAHWAADVRESAVIEIADSATYLEPKLSIEPIDGTSLVIQAASRQRPHLLLPDGLEITGSHPTASITLSGTLVEGRVHLAGALGKLRLLHATLVPGLGLDASGAPQSGKPSVVAEPPATGLRLEMAFSISGPLQLPTTAAGVWILDSIVDGLGGDALGSQGTPLPAAWIERSSVLGKAWLDQLTTGTEVLFQDLLTVSRRQVGCLRFSFVPDGSSTPRRFRCQPDLEIADEVAALEQAQGSTSTAAQRAQIHDAVVAWLSPSFTQTRYGQPAYAQLDLHCPTQITAGAENGAEMGAFCNLSQPQRTANLLLRLSEYLPFGLTPGLIYVT
jgi:hypothetical protein